MNTVKEELKNNPDTTSLNLEFLQITDLTLLLPLLEQFPNLKQLSLHGNRLRFLPSEISRLETVEELDISNNMLTSIDDVLTVLQYMPNLKILKINIKNREELETIKIRMKNLLMVNNQQVARIKAPRPPPKKPLPTITEKDLEDVAVLYDKIRLLHKDREIDADQQLAQEFDDTVERVMKELNSKLRNDTDSEYMAQTRVLCAKYALYDMCFTKFISLMGILDQKMEVILELVHNSYMETFKGLAQIVMYKQLNVDGKEQSMKVKQRLKIYESQIERLKKHRDMLLQQVSQLNSQNEKYLERLVSGYGRPETDKKMKTPQRNNGESLKSTKKIDGMVSSESMKNMKSLNVRQIHEIFQEMINNKVQFDKKCREQHRAMQTMQEFMYTHFEKRYGLKSLALEWVMSLVNGIKKYYQEDTSIALMGKILRNEMPESAWNEQKFVTKSIQEGMKTQIKRKTHRLDHEVQAAVREIQKSNIGWQDAQEIVRFYFGRQDVQNVIEDLKDRLDEKTKKVKYPEFINIILSNHTKIQDRIMSPLVEAFKHADSDNDGIIDIEQVEQIFQEVADKQQLEHQDRLMDAVRNTTPGSIITFSMVCDFFKGFPAVQPILPSSSF